MARSERVQDIDSKKQNSDHSKKRDRPADDPENICNSDCVVHFHFRSLKYIMVTRSHVCMMKNISSPSTKTLTPAPSPA